MPVYNGAAYISRALQTALDQRSCNLEVVVVDDGSTDNTAQFIKQLQKTESRIRYIYQENTGQAAARNNGIEHSSGEIIAFLDADDLWLPNKLEKQIPLFEDPEVGLAYTGIQYIDNQDHESRGSRQRVCHGRVMKQLLEDNFITCSSVVVRRSLLEQHAFSFREQRQGVEDWDLWLRIAMVSGISSCDDLLVKYRIHPGNISREQDLMYRGQVVTLNDIARDILNAESLSEKEKPGLSEAVQKSLSRASLRYGHWLLAQGRKDEAGKMMKRAIELNRTDLRNWWGCVKCFFSINAFNAGELL